MAESLLQSVPPAPVLSPCTSGPRKQSSSSSDSISMSSPEFEFWMVRNPPIFPHPKLLSADELFSDGALLPLHRLHRSPVHDPNDPNQEKSRPQETITNGSGSDHGGLTMVASKSWKDIFKKIEKGNKKETKNHDTAGAGAGAGASNNSSSHRIRSAPELININIWPFWRSRSAGNGGIRPSCRMVAAAGTTRKVSSAPCSRSNSTGGDFKSRKWGASPTQGTTGVQVSKNTPLLWQVWRGGGGTGGYRRTATDLVEGNARNGVQPTKKNNEFAGNNLPPREGESG